MEFTSIEKAFCKELLKTAATLDFCKELLKTAATLDDSNRVTGTEYYDLVVADFARVHNLYGAHPETVKFFRECMQEVVNEAMANDDKDFTNYANFYTKIFLNNPKFYTNNL